MPKSKTIATWREMSQEFIHNQPPKQNDWQACLFVNTVEVRETPQGRKYLIRKVGCEWLPADSKEEMEKAVSDFILQEDVRLLAKGLSANDFDRLPREDKNPGQ